MLNPVVESTINWISVIFVTVTIPLYVFVLTVLFIYRKNYELKGAFFTLCISLGICDIFTIINNYIGYRFPYWGWGTDFYLNGGPALAKLFILLTWTLRVIQGVGVTLLAVNRATAVIWPFKYAELWSPRMLKIAIGFQLLSGVIVAFPLVFQDYYWAVSNGSCLVITFVDIPFKDRYFVGNFFMQMVVVLIIATSYIGLFATFHFKKDTVYQQSVSCVQKRSREVKLAVMGSIVCFFEILWFVFALYTGVINPLPTDVFFLVYDTLTDVYGGISPYLIFAFSSAVRERIKILLKINKSSTVVRLPTLGYSAAFTRGSLSHATHQVDHQRFCSPHTIVLRQNFRA